MHICKPDPLPEVLRNCEFVRIKNIPLPLFIRHLPSFILGEISDFLYFCVRRRRPGLFLKAKLEP